MFMSFYKGNGHGDVKPGHRGGQIIDGQQHNEGMVQFVFYYFSITS